MPLAVEHFDITIGAAVQQLPSRRLRKVSFQPDGGNSGPIYLGGDNSTDADSWGVRLPAPSGSVPAAPYEDGEFQDGALNLSAYWVFGTENDVLHVKALVYTPGTLP